MQLCLYLNRTNLGKKKRLFKDHQKNLEQNGLDLQRFYLNFEQDKKWLNRKCKENKNRI